MGIDVGTMTTKGVIIDKYHNIIASSYLDTNGEPVKTVKKIIKCLGDSIDFTKYCVVSVGVTGSARKLIGTMLDSNIIKNEVVASAVGTTMLYPSVRTIIEMGGQDSKIILINDGGVTDYAINTFCAAGNGAFISSLARRLNMNVDELVNCALTSKKNIDIESRCAVFTETDLMCKIQNGYNKADIIDGVFRGIVNNYLNNVVKGKKIISPIVFNGGISKNIVIVKKLEEAIGEHIIVNKNSHLMGAIGVALLAMNSKIEKEFNFNIDNINMETKIMKCNKCSNYCEMVGVYKNMKLIDYWGNKCEKGKIKKSEKKSNLVV